MESKVRVLCTADVSAGVVAGMYGQGYAVDVISFIETIDAVDAQREADLDLLFQQEINAVFTSAQAAKAVCGRLNGSIPQWRIYCTGGATRDMLLMHFGVGAIAGNADSAAQLAEVIIEDKIKEATFFCGNRRLDELPGKLSAAGISLKEMAVYYTIDKAVNVAGENYDAVLFFSPSAVHSFFSMNAIALHAVVFAIGHTTAQAIAGLCGNKVVISNMPSKKAVMDNVVKYFSVKQDNKHIKVS